MVKWSLRSGKEPLRKCHTDFVQAGKRKVSSLRLGSLQNENGYRPYWGLTSVSQLNKDYVSVLACTRPQSGQDFDRAQSLSLPACRCEVLPPHASCGLEYQ